MHMGNRACFPWILGLAFVLIWQATMCGQATKGLGAPSINLNNYKSIFCCRNLTTTKTNRGREWERTTILGVFPLSLSLSSLILFMKLRRNERVSCWCWFGKRCASVDVAVSGGSERGWLPYISIPLCSQPENAFCIVRGAWNSV